MKIDSEARRSNSHELRSPTLRNLDDVAPHTDKSVCATYPLARSRLAIRKYLCDVFVSAVGLAEPDSGLR
jgi:hypothetical protein